MKRYSKYIVFFTAIDFIAAFLAWMLFFYARKWILDEQFVPVTLQLIARAGIIALFWMFLYYLSGFYYNEIFRKSRLREFVNLLQISIFGSIIIFFVLLLDDEGVYSYKSYYKTYFTYFFIHFFVSLLFKLSVVSFFHNLVKKGSIYFNTLIIGGGEKALQIIYEIETQNKHLGLKILGYVNGFGHKNKIEFPSQYSYFGDYQEIEDIIVANNIE